MSQTYSSPVQECLFPEHDQAFVELPEVGGDAGVRRVHNIGVPVIAAEDFDDDALLLAGEGLLC